MNPSVCWPDNTLPMRIYCAPGVLTSLEMVAADGLLAMPRTGLGVGGLLLGKRRSEGIEILKTVEIPCSHAMGPAFVLTVEEIAAAGLSETDEAAGTERVGWYCSKPSSSKLGLSRTHAPMVLSEHDRVLFDALCPETWQVALLIQPDLGKATRAAFGMREGNTFLIGAPRDLAWQELAAYEESEPEPVLAVDLASETAAVEAEMPVAIPVAMPRSGTLFGEQEDSVEALRKPARWPLRVLAGTILLALLAAAAFFERGYWMPHAQLDLAASSDGTGVVFVLWNREALNEDGRATLVIDDGAGPLRIIHLNQAEVRAGWYQYHCRAGKVTATFMAGDLTDTVTLAMKVARLPVPRGYLPESGTSK
jgi:hypothetical protein